MSVEPPQVSPGDLQGFADPERDSFAAAHLRASAGVQASAEDGEILADYRELSRGAIATALVGLVSCLSLFAPALLFIPLVGMALGLLAIWNIRRQPDVLTGTGIAGFGLALSALCFVGGTARATHEYLTEVPEGGYIRISFDDLQPDNLRHPELPVSPAALELDGQRVFIKGYLYPDGQQSNIKRFVLIPDLATCCFGGQPALTNMIEVTLRDPQRVSFSRQHRKLSGILKVDTRLKPITGLNGVYYQLDAEQVQ